MKQIHTDARRTQSVRTKHGGSTAAWQQARRSQTASDLDKSPLGELRGTRVRPTYSVPIFVGRLTPAFFPKSNVKKLSNGMVLRWKASPWNRVESNLPGVQKREVSAAVFEQDELACYFRAMQTRNATSEELSVGVYSEICDSESALLCHHAQAIQAALFTLCDGREWLEPGEAVCELCELFVTSRYKSRRAWPEALLELLTKLARTNGGELVCVLEAQPLELVWRARGLQSRRLKSPPEPSPREEALARRRQAALVRLYARELKFESVGEHLMGQQILVCDFELA